MKTSSEDDRHIRQWIRLACDSNGVSELAQVIVVEWNPRFTRRLGDAGYSSTTYRARIRLSIPLWPRSTEEDRRETVVHEACHIIAFYNNWGQWHAVYNAVADLAHAYTLTGNPAYVHKAAVLLDRIADVYPEMDEFFADESRCRFGNPRSCAAQAGSGFL